jgi:DNA-binding CsgD family transcriptional regulator
MSTRGRPKHPDILTPRQWDVLALLRRGLTNEEIARELNISADGVKFHVSDILSRLGVESRHEAAAWQPAAATSRFGLLLAPALLVKQLKLGAFGYAAAVAAAGATAVGVALLVWGVASTSGDRDRSIAVNTPGPARTGIPEVDRVIDLLVHQDVDGLVKVAEYGPINCTVRGTGGSGPPCALGQPEGSPVTVFTLSQCKGTYATNDDELKASFGLALQRQPSAAVYAVLRDNTEDRGRDSYWIAITQDRPSQATADVSFWNVTTEGRIVTLVNQCGPIGAAQQVAYRFPINPDFVLGPFNNCSPAPGETANFMISVDGYSPGGVKPQFWGEAQSTIGYDTGERAIVTVTEATKWYGDIQRLDDVRQGNVLEAVGRRQADCTILAETILSPLPPRTFRNDALNIELP